MIKRKKTVLIAKDLAENDKQTLTALLLQYKDVFAWSFDDMKGLDPTFYQHQINLHKDAKPVQQHKYRLNPNYAIKVKEEIDKLLKVEFIQPAKKSTWLSPIVVVPEKNGKIRVCVEYRKLNAATITDAFPLPFTDGILDAVASHEIYSFLDGFSGYNQVRMNPEDQEKTSLYCISNAVYVCLSVFAKSLAINTVFGSLSFAPTKFCSSKVEA